jgi:hypothetical protein
MKNKKSKPLYKVGDLVTELVDGLNLSLGLIVFVFFFYVFPFFFKFLKLKM